MSDQDRIKLAEAVFYGHISINGKLREDFDPFTDANDDYAVLKWLRAQNNKGWQYHLSQLNDGKGRYKWDYFVGDYARAALEVLDDE